jgi:hypothetical protein
MKESDQAGAVASPDPLAPDGEGATLRQAIEAMFPGRLEAVVNARATNAERGESYSAICAAEREAEAKARYSGRLYFTRGQDWFSRRGGDGAVDDGMSGRDHLWEEEARRRRRANHAADKWVRERIWKALIQDVRLALRRGDIVAKGRKAGAVEHVVVIPSALWAVLKGGFDGAGDVLTIPGTRDRWVFVRYFRPAPPVMTEVQGLGDAQAALQPHPESNQRTAVRRAQAMEEFRIWFGAAVAASPDRVTYKRAQLVAKAKELGIPDDKIHLRLLLNELKATLPEGSPWKKSGRQRER